MGTTLSVQDLAGDWQGTLSAGAQQPRLILKIQRADNATWNATLFSIDQSPDFGTGMAANVVTVRGLELNVTVNAVRGTYQGTFSALPRANHYVFLSNEADVLREVNAFLAALSQ